MFIIFGTRQVARDVKNELPVRQVCPKCSLLSEMRLQRQASYFTLFFIPLFPISKSEEIVKCGRCNAAFYRNQNASPPPVNYAERTVVVCPECETNCGIPAVLRNSILVTCPRCRTQFEVNIRKKSF